MSPSPASQSQAGAARPSGLERWLPAWGWLRRYDRRDLGGDVTAGIVVAVMLVPQGMAYAMLAGMPPVAGLYASAIPVLAYVLFGSSRQLAVGPSALTALLTLAGVSQLATPGSASFVVLAGALALMAGLFQLLLGLLRAGFITNFLSSAVINGFTSGAAIIIAVNQLKDLLGVKADAGAGLVGLVRGLLPHLHQTNLPTLVIGAGAVALLLALKRWRVRALPGPLVAVVLGTVAVGLTHLDAAGVAVVGRVPRGLPLPALPAIDLGTLPALVPAALTLAFVGFMEAIAVGRSLAARERTTVDANRELIGLGLANLVSGVVRGYPLGGGFGRSAVNYEAGARTQLASVVRAALLVLTLLALTPLFTFLPRAVLGAIVFVAVIGLVDLREPVRLFRVRPADGWTLIVTFAATLFIGVEAGILIGVAFSLLVFVARSAYPHVAELGWLQGDGVFRNVLRFEDARRYRGVLLARPDASLYFANMAFLESWLDDALRRRAADAGRARARRGARLLGGERRRCRGAGGARAAPGRLGRRRRGAPSGRREGPGARPAGALRLQPAPPRARGAPERGARVGGARCRARGSRQHRGPRRRVRVRPGPAGRERERDRDRGRRASDRSDRSQRCVPISPNVRRAEEAPRGRRKPMKRSSLPPLARRAWPLAAALALVLTLTACGNTYKTVSVKDLRAASEPNRIVLDVREPYEYAAGHIAGAKLLPLSQLQSRLDEVPADQPVYVYCHSGNRSKQASEILAKAGKKDIRDVRGGILAWEAAGYPITRE